MPKSKGNKKRNISDINFSASYLPGIRSSFVKDQSHSTKRQHSVVELQPHNTYSLSFYKRPDWSGFPQKSCRMEVYSDGHLIQTLDLPDDREFLSVGASSKSHLRLSHYSVDLNHLIIQFDQSGSIFLYDLGSKYGTKVNNSVLTPHKHYPLQPNSTISIAKDPAKYILISDENLNESSSLKNEQTKKIPFDAETETEDEISILRENVLSWFRKNDYSFEINRIEPSDRTDNLLVLRIKIPETDENGKYFSALGTGVTEKEAEDELYNDAMKQIEHIESLHISEEYSNLRKTKVKEMLKAVDQEEDDFFDRTSEFQHKQKRFKRSSRGVQTSESLRSKKEIVKHRIQSIEDKIAHLNRRDSHTIVQSDDELDAYMSIVSAQLEKDEILALEKEKSDLIQTLNNIDSLLEIASSQKSI